MLEIKTVFVTKKDTRFCEWCHKPLPPNARKQKKFCSEECKERARKNYKHRWYLKNKEKEKLEDKMTKEEIENFKESAKNVADGYIN